MQTCEVCEDLDYCPLGENCPVAVEAEMLGVASGWS